MKFGTEVLENFLLICIVIMTVSAFLFLGGGVIDANLLAASMTNILLLLVVGAMYFNAIILLRIYSYLTLSKKK
ncbi:MAG: hypothetical protein U9P44_03695 [archaeon]|nr:hypothetical protein [archaeon]